MGSEGCGRRTRKKKIQAAQLHTADPTQEQEIKEGGKGETETKSQ